MVTTCSPRPMRAVQRARLITRHHLYCEPSGVGGEAARGEMVELDAILEVSYGILCLGVAVVVGLQVGLQVRGIPVPAGDETVIARAGERR